MTEPIVETIPDNAENAAENVENPVEHTAVEDAKPAPKKRQASWSKRHEAQAEASGHR